MYFLMLKNTIIGLNLLKKLYLSVATIFTLTVFSGCDSTSANNITDMVNNISVPEISCSSDNVKKKAIEMYQPSLEDSLLELFLSNHEFLGPLVNLYGIEGIKTAMDSGLLSNGGDMDKIIKSYEETQENVKKVMKLSSSDINNIRTTNKDKELNKVMCSANLIFMVEGMSENSNFEIKYQAQIGDDQKTIYVDMIID